MRHMRLFDQIGCVDHDRTGVEVSMQRFLITSAAKNVYMEQLIGEPFTIKMLLDNKVTLYELKNKAMVSTTKAGEKTTIGGIDCCQTDVTTV